MLNRQTFNKGMAILCEIYKREVTDLLLTGYYMVLSKLEDQQFEDAIQKILETRIYTDLPTPGDIYQAVIGNSEIKAIQALKKLEYAVDHYGYYYSMVFDDPIIHAVVDRMGGWEWMTTQTYEEWKWIRKDFTKLYSQLSSLNINLIDAPQRLIGYCERTNDSFEKDDRLQHMIINLSEQQKMIGQDEQKFLE